MTFFAFGLNHETAPVAVRETFALGEVDKRAVYRSLSLSEEAELVVLSTCNRTEVYVYGERSDVAAVRSAIAQWTGHDWPEDASFSLEDEQAIRHVLRVTCGLKSLVLGDAQILSQVKEAYRLAVEEDCVGAIMHRLMHTAFRAAKRVVNETALSSGNASVSTAAVAAARRYFERHGSGLAGCRVLLVGAGQMGRLALEALQAHRPAAVNVTNRSRERARALAASYGAGVVRWEDRHAAVGDADLVLVASGADEPVLRAAHMPPARRKGPATLLVDIAVPRNVDPAIDDLPGYAVVDLDDINVELVRTEAMRRAEVPAAEQICEEALSEYVSWVFHQQALQPAIHAIRDMFESIRRQEVERHHHRFSEIDREELDRLTGSIIQKLLAVPVVRLKSVDPNSIDFVRGIKLLHALFSRPACEDESAEAHPTGPVSTESREGVGNVQCPFDPPVKIPEDVVDLEEHLREALRVPSSSDQKPEAGHA